MNTAEWFATQRIEEEKNKILKYEDFCKQWKQKTQLYQGNNLYMISNIESLLALMRDYGDDKIKCRNILRNEINNMEYITPYVEKEFWFSSSKNGLNLRVGISDMGQVFNENKMPVIGDKNVHGIIVGRTGSGKSVMLNNVLASLMLEYAPWELELYLIDFKKVELSRFVTDEQGRSPHVKVCAATGEVRYALSLIRYIKKIMENRETLLSRLGYTNTRQLREEFSELLFPRILLVVDEFQQMFLYATAKQRDELQNALTAITRKGRATGIHMLFASQEAKGTGLQITNFNLRFALPCEAEVSSEIIGNSAAAKLKKAYGYVILNNKTGKEEDNITYIVPYISNDDLNNVLSIVDKLADENNFKFKDTQKYYLEDKQIDIKDLDSLLKKRQIADKRNNISSDTSGRYFFSLVLGRSVVFNQHKFDIENIIIERGQNKNTLIISPDKLDLVYMMKLFTVNLANTYFSYPFSNNYDFSNYSIININPSIVSLYPKFKDDLKYSKNAVKTFNDFASGYNFVVHSLYQMRHFVWSWLYSNSGKKTFSTFFEDYCVYRLTNGNPQAENVDDYRNALNCLSEMFESYPEDSEALSAKVSVIEANINSVIEKQDNDEFWNIYQNMVIRWALTGLKNYVLYRKAIEYNENISLEYIFPPHIVFINGIDILDSFPKDFLDFISNCTRVNMYCVFFSNIEVDSRIKDTCNYFFVSGQNDDLYEKYITFSTSRATDSIVFEAKVKNTNNIFAFKKYRIEGNKAKEHLLSIDFDSLLR